MGEFIITDHRAIDKDFGLYNHAISMQVDYDDVQHTEVDVAAIYVQKILNAHWNENEFKNFLKDRLLCDWKDNVDDIQSAYMNVEEYLNQYGFKIVAK